MLMIFSALGLHFAQIIFPSLMTRIIRAVGNDTMLGAKDPETDTPLLILRARRASANLQESLPIFLTIGVLAVIGGAEMETAIQPVATLWLGLRVVYLLLYLANTGITRTIIWVLSVICLFNMAKQLM